MINFFNLIRKYILKPLSRILYEWWLCMWDLDLRLKKESRCLFLRYFWHSLNLFFESIAKIVSSLKSNHQIKLILSKYLIHKVEAKARIFLRIFLLEKNGDFLDFVSVSERHLVVKIEWVNLSPTPTTQMPRIIAEDKLTGIAQVKARKGGKRKILNTFRDKIKCPRLYFLKGLAIQKSIQ